MTQISKWLSLCLIAMLAFTVSSFAQEDKPDEEPVVVYDPDDVDGTRGFSRSKIVIGGFGTLNGGSGIISDPFYGTVPARQFIYGGTPFVGYRLMDKLIVGAGLNFFKQSTVLSPSTGETPVIISNTFGGRILSRYLLFHIFDPAGIYAQVEFGVDRGREKYKVDSEVIYKSDPVTQSSFLLGLGYTSNHYQGFGYNVEVFYDVVNRTEYLPFWSELIPRVGVTWGF